MFCPKCGSLLLPKRDKKKKKVMACSCGYVEKEGGSITLKEEVVRDDKELEIVDDSLEENSLPLTEAECPKCKHMQAHYYTMQTRASDEPETKFLICEKCKYKWRDYS